MEERRQGCGYRRVQTDERCEPAEKRGHERTDGNAYIAVPTELAEVHLQTEAEDGGYGGIEEGRPVATKLHAEATTGETGTDGDHPMRILFVDMLQRLQLLLIPVEIPVLSDGRPQHLTDLGDDRKLDAVTVDTLVFREGVRLIGEVHHDDVEVETDVYVLFGQAEISLAAFHVPHDTLAVGIARHEQGAGAHEEVELAAEDLHGRGILVTLGLMVYHALFETHDALCVFVLSALMTFQES